MDSKNIIYRFNTWIQNLEPSQFSWNDRERERERREGGQKIWDHVTFE